VIPKYSIPVDRSHTYGILSINQNYVASLPLTHAHFSSVLTTVLVYKVLHGLALQYLGPLNYVADLPGRRTLRSAGTNRLAVPPVKLTTVANHPGFPGCRPTDMERSTRRRDFSRIVIHLPSATQNSYVCKIFFLIIAWTGLHLTSVSQVDLAVVCIDLATLNIPDLLID